jgi:hypothetical protein|nr:MAG TPA: hypothetical protein [Caudoviricetes sp.]
MTTREKIAEIDHEINAACDTLAKSSRDPDIPVYVAIENYKRQRKKCEKRAENLIYEDSWAKRQRNGRAFFRILINSCRKSKRGGEEALYLLYREKEEEFRCLHALLKE